MKFGLIDNIFSLNSRQSNFL
uniref:Uncharacterized protein n=1 Tax=Rhizophora mucronata TaxID=61149 RepID=A0A2P2PWB6_RHIMU